MTFYLGTHRPTWLWRVRDVPLFVSHRVLDGTKRRASRYPRATTRWALDSGGFTELNLYGGWRTTLEQYVSAVRRYVDELGSLDWASPQDWMCEPWMVEKTGLSVERHQELTVDNYLRLRELAPDLPFIPVLQGWQLDDYVTCVGLYAENGIDLREYPVVGVGSVCRRQDADEIGAIMSRLRRGGIRCHGFGVKELGLRKYGEHLTSSDSMAWSYDARRDAARATGRRQVSTCTKGTCANCMHYALSWRDRLIERASHTL